MLVKILSTRIIGEEWGKRRGYIGMIAEPYYRFSNGIGVRTKDGILLLDSDEYEIIESED